MSLQKGLARQLVMGVLVCLVLAVLPLMINPYFLSIVIMAFFWIMLTVGLNLIGSMGYICICIATFYGIGGYTSGLLTVKIESNFFISLITGALAAGLSGFLIGIPVFRVRGHYFAIATLAFALIISLVLSSWHELTNGDRGIVGIFSPITNARHYYYLMLGVMAGAVATTHFVRHGRIGRQLVAIKEDEDLAQQVGVNTFRVKLIAFVLAAVLAGLAGGLMVHHINFVHPDFFSFAYSFNVIMGMIVGGIGTTGGAILGGVIAVALPEVLRFAGGWRHIIIGSILILVMLLLPKGIFGSWVHFRREKGRLSP